MFLFQGRNLFPPGLSSYGRTNKKAIAGDQNSNFSFLRPIPIREHGERLANGNNPPASYCRCSNVARNNARSIPSRERRCSMPNCYTLASMLAIRA